MAKQKPVQKVDPNKYLKNKDIKPESKFDVLATIGRMFLMVLGIVGFIIQLFQKDGLSKQIFDKLFESTINMLMIPIIIFTLWWLNRWMSSGSKSEKKRSGDIPMYLMMMLGAYYLYKLITTGSF